MLTLLVTVAERAAREAWLYVPHLHPVDIEEVVTGINDTADGTILQVICSTVYKTGVEMDALFATCAACTAAALGHERFRIGYVKIVQKVKLPQKYEIMHRQVHQTGVEQPITFSGEGLKARCIGYLKLRSTTLDVVRGRCVEKGDPIEASRTTALLALKRAWQLVPGLPRPKIEAAKISVELLDDHVRAEMVCNMPRGAGPECLFAVLTCLTCFWDMVKKYEKDETGQYPYTYMYDIELEIRRV